MKRMIVCIMGLCLVAQDLFASRGVAGWEYIEWFAEGRVQQLQEEYKDTEKLERDFREFFGDAMFISEVPMRFKRKFNVSDETMRTALMNIIHKCSTETEWGKRGWELEAGYPGKWFLDSAIEWLGVCADAETKQFLMDIAMDDTKWRLCRMNAIEAYLRSADAQETRDAIARFLTDDMREAIDPYCTYDGAMLAYGEAEGDVAKRAAIISSLTAAVQAREEDREHFAYADKRLAEQNKEYAKSPQRKAALKRMNIKPLKEPVRNKPVKNKSVPWKLPLLIGTLILGGAVVAWCCFKKKTRNPQH